MTTAHNAGQRVALVTGANRGIGLETARQLGNLGIQVVLGSRDLSRGEKAVADLVAKGIAAAAIRLDVTSATDREGARRYFEDRHGRLDILVNNAGILLKEHSCAVAQEELKEVFESNFFGPVALTQCMLPLIRNSPAGRIVNVSSVLGSLTLQSDPTSRIYQTKVLSYDSSKTALNAFTVHLAYELRDTPIKVNSADPGWVRTEMGGEHALLEVSEGCHTSVRLATLPSDGPTGGFFHLGQTFPW